MHTEEKMKSNYNNKTKNNVEENKNLRSILLKSIRREKDESEIYEILKNIFNLINIDRFCDCLYSSISYHLYSSQESHRRIRSEVYECFLKNKNKYISYFITECNENENEIDYGDLIDNYIKENDKEDQYG